MLKKTLLSAICVLAIFPAYAQTNTGTGTSTVDSRTNSNAGAAANPSINQNFGGTPANTTQNLNNVPAIQLPSVIGGNPCGIGGSLGGSVMGFGIGGGMMVEGESCEQRQRLALYHNIGMARLNAGDRAGAQAWFAVSHEVACQNKETRQHFKVAGMPCAADRAQAAAQVPVAPVPVQANPVPVAAPKARAFDPAQYSSSSDCYTAAYAQGVDLAACKQVWRETRAAVAAGVVGPNIR